MSGRIISEPDLCLSLLVWFCAASLFPLHLGWAGASWIALVFYLAVAAGLMVAADALLRRVYFSGWRMLGSDYLLCSVGLAVPALAAFALGAAVAPTEEAFEDALCRIGGFSTDNDTAGAEADDAFDLTADCLSDQ